MLQSYEGMLANRRNQLALLNEELDNTRGLVKEGYAPRNRQLELERMVAESSTAIADLQGNICARAPARLPSCASAPSRASRSTARRWKRSWPT